MSDVTAATTAPAAGFKLPRLDICGDGQVTASRLEVLSDCGDIDVYLA